MKNIFDSLFVKRSPYSLAFFRIIITSYLLYFHQLVWDRLIYAIQSTSFQPIGIFKTLPHPISVENLRFIYFAWILFLFFVFIGFASRYTTAILFFLSLIVLGYSSNFGKVVHDTHMILMSLLVLAVSRHADVLSLDSVLYEKRKEKSWHYGWPLRFLQIYVVVSLTTLGMQKILQQGLVWAFSDKFYLTVYTHPSSGLLHEWFIGLPIWVSMLAAASALLVFELFSPLALFYPFNCVYPFFWSAMHVGVTLLFGGHKMFFSQIAVYFCFLNFENLSKRWK